MKSVSSWFGVLFVALVFLGLGGLAACASSDPPPAPDVVGEDTVAPADVMPAEIDEPEDVGPDLPPPPPDIKDTVDGDLSPGDVEPQPDTAQEIDPANPGPPPAHRREEYAAPRGELQAGIGMGFVEGPVGVSMAGYGGRTGRINSTWSDLLKGTHGFYTRLPLKAVVFDVEGEQFAVLKIPMMTSESALTDGTAAKLEELYGIDFEGRLITAASHSHHTPARFWRVPDMLGMIGCDSPDEEVIDRLTTAFAEAIKAALDDLAPAEWGYAYRDDWDPDDRVYRDRRRENDHLFGKDPRLMLLAVRRLDGTPMATIINFAMHGTSVSSSNDLLTDDAPGAVEMKFEEHFYAEEGHPNLGLFVQSAGGDAAPTGGELGHGGTQRLEKLGWNAAGPILDLYRQIEWRREATLSVRSRRIDLRYMWMGYDEYPEFIGPDGEPYWWGALTCVVEGLEPGESMEGHPKHCSAIDWIMSLTGGSIPHGEMHQMYLTVARLDGLFLVTLPGEPNHSLVDYLRREVDSREALAESLDVMAVGYSQDYFLYLLAPEDWFLGGYETTGSAWGPLGGSYIVDRQMELVDDMLAGYNRPVFYEESPNLSPPKPFEPRALERSLDPGEVVIATEPTYERTDAVRFGFGGGDPAVGNPLVVLQREIPDHGFEDLPSPCGREERSYDNTRDRMITIYDPDPRVLKPILEERRHHWYVIWEVPPDLPAGIYRMRAEGPYFDGTETLEFTALSEPFEVVQSSSAELDALLEGESLALRLTLAPVPFAREEGRSWPLTGWRLFDPEVGPDERLTVRAPLRVRLLFDPEAGHAPIETTAQFDFEAAAHVVDLADAGAAEPPVEVEAGLLSDLLESLVAAPVVEPGGE